LIKNLLQTFSRAGRIDWISVRLERGKPVTVLTEVTALPDAGLVGDHYGGTNGNRHITLMQAEHLPAIASFVGLAEVSPELLRRNLLVSGINLLALKDQRIQIGDGADAVVLEITGQCHPCSKMETALGPGGYNAMRGHGGITARVIQGGLIRVGDALWSLVI
jgi:MOSC domain-containing protein YiiM